MPLRVGYCASHEQWPAAELVGFAVQAERAGFDALWVSDHFHPWQDNQGHAGHPWVTLAIMGQRTSRITLGTGVTCPSYRYRPPEVAQAFASLAGFYPGRIFLGVGTGEALNEVAAGGGWGPYRERAARLVEAIGLIRRLWRGDWVTHRGRYFELPLAKLYDAPSIPPPIYMAASGPRAVRLAGEHADGLITDPDTARDAEKMAAFERGARDAGKDPARLPRLVELYVCVGDREEALSVAPLWRFGPIGWQLLDLADPRESQRRAEADVPLEHVIQRWIVGPDPERHVQALRDLQQRGVTDVYIHSAQHDQAHVIDFYGRHVIPALR